MCIRQDVSTAVQTSARVSSTPRSLSPSIAIDVSAFLTANVPPKPQHSRALVELDEVDPADRAQQPLRPVADPERADRVARRVQRHAVRERRADVLDAEHVDEELGQLVDRRAVERHAQPAVVLAHEADARRARRDDDLGVAEHALRSARASGRASSS